jgi:hypothetical protein
MVVETVVVLAMLEKDALLTLTASLATVIRRAPCLHAGMKHLMTHVQTESRMATKPVLMAAECTVKPLATSATRLKPVRTAWTAERQLALMEHASAASI